MDCEEYPAQRESVGLGMPQGLCPGYEREISELYVYNPIR